MSQCSRVQFPTPSKPPYNYIALGQNSRQAFNLAGFSKDLTVADGGVLTDAHVEMVTEECERLGFDQTLTDFVLGVQ